MATDKSVDQSKLLDEALSASEKSYIRVALTVYGKTIERAIKAENNPAINELRQKDVRSLQALLAKFQ